VVDAGCVEADHDLQREHQVPVHIVVQCVQVTLAVLQQDRVGFGLTDGMAHLKPLVQAVRPGSVPAQLAHQSRAIGNNCGYRACFNAITASWERFSEVPVFALTKPVTSHNDGRPEPGVIDVERGDVSGVVRSEQWAGQGATAAARLAASVVPPRMAATSV
jgi:hypothetical protein